MKSAATRGDSASITALGDQLGLRSGDALLVIDVQHDFLPGGSLAVTDGDQVVPVLNSYMAAFSARDLPIFLTRCWHPDNHCSFKSKGGPWPPHCVQGTYGAELPRELIVPPQARLISKGTQLDVDAYSGFSGTSLATQLRALNVQRLFIGGLATDYCVHASVLDARSQGFEVVVLVDAIRAVNVEPQDGTRAIQQMVQRGASLHEPSAAIDP